MAKIITATFKTRQAAEEALTKLEQIGIEDDQIGLVVTDETRGSSFNIDEGTKVDEGFAAGATAGGLIGAILAGIAGAGTIAIPGLNLVIWGSFAAGLAGLGAGAVAGGLVGMLVGAGIPEHEARLYEDMVREGAILLAVKPADTDQKHQIRDILDHADAYHIAA